MLKIPIKFRKILKARLGSFLKKLKLGSARQKVGLGASLVNRIYFCIRLTLEVHCYVKGKLLDLFLGVSGNVDILKYLEFM